METSAWLLGAFALARLALTRSWGLQSGQKAMLQPPSFELILNRRETNESWSIFLLTTELYAEYKCVQKLTTLL